MADNLSGCRRTLLFVHVYWRTIIAVLSPLVLSPLIIFHNTKDYRCVYANAVLLISFMVDGLPLPVTALLPLVLYPLLSILDSRVVASCYMRDTIMTMVTSMMCIVAVVDSRVHLRVAIFFLKMFHPSHRCLCLGCAFVTMLLSMWIPNPATVSVILPIIQDILQILHNEGITHIYTGDSSASNSRHAVSMSSRLASMTSSLNQPMRLSYASLLDQKTSDEDNADEESNIVYDNQSPIPNTVGDSPPVISNIGLSYYLICTYATTIGGIGTLVGTPNNMAFKGLYECLFPKAPIVQFPNFMMHCTPLMVVIQFLNYLYFQIFYMGLCRPNSFDAKQCRLNSKERSLLRSILQNQYTALGPFSFHEKIVLIFFIIGIILFVTHNKGFSYGWSQFFEENSTGYSVNSTLIVLLLYMIPDNPEFTDFFKSNAMRSQVPTHCSAGILRLKNVRLNVPWGLFLILGTGFTVCEANKASGADKLLESFFHSKARDIPKFLLPFFVIIGSKILAEFGTGVGVISITIPTVAYLGIATRTNPLLLMMAAYIGGTFVFHLPSSSPTNGIVANFAQIPSRTMVIAGIGPSIIIVLTSWLAFYVWTPLVYKGIHEYPKWAEPS